MEFVATVVLRPQRVRAVSVPPQAGNAITSRDTNGLRALGLTDTIEQSTGLQAFSVGPSSNPLADRYAHRR